MIKITMMGQGFELELEDAGYRFVNAARDNYQMQLALDLLYAEAKAFLVSRQPKESTD